MGNIGVCKEASINGALHSMDVRGLSSTQILEMEATSATSNFLMTQVDAFTRVNGVVEDGLTITGDGDVFAKCSTGALGSIDIGKSDVRVVSNVTGVTISANITLGLNLLTSTCRSAHVDSLLVTFSNVNTSCSIGS